MAGLVSPQCVAIADAIENLEAERAELQRELQDAPPPPKSYLVREIGRVNKEIGQLRVELRQCEQENPPPPRPDLLAQTVRFHVNHSTRRLGVAARIKNIGGGNASGPFRVDLAATLYRGGETISFVRVFEVPAGVTIYAEQEYVTEDMVVPLFYRDESPSAKYEFEFLVDTEQRVSESNEGNNRFFVPWWTTRPASVFVTTPFEIDGVSGEVKASQPQE